MRLFLTALIFAAVSTFIYAQQVKLIRDLQKDAFVNGWHNWLNYHAKEIPDNGKFIVYYDSAFLHIGLTGEMKEGKRNGTWTSYYPSGRVCDITPYKEGKYHGLLITYSVRGDTSSRTGYYDGKRDGPSITWADKPWTSGRYVVSVENAVRGAREGWQLKFDWTGDTLQKSFYKNDVLVGEEVTWYRGQVISIVHNEPNKGKVYTYPRYSEAKDQTTLYLAFVSYKSMDVSAFRKLDSLSYYTSLQQLTIEIDSAHVKDIPKITEKLKSVSMLKNLMSLGFVGPFPEIPSTVFACPTIESINLSRDITSIPAAIMEWKNLRVVRIGDSSKLNIAATLKLLSRCSSLRTLQFPLDSGTSLPREFALMTNLYHLSVAGWMTCDDYYSGDVDYRIIYQLKNLRSFEVCSDQYWKTDQIAFGANLPDCQLQVFETCFSPGTKVLMANQRFVAIENVSVGDSVLAWNESTGTMETTVVIADLRHYQPIASLLELKFTFENGESSCIHTTANHPFFVNGEWITAGQLTKGDEIQYFRDNLVTTVVVEDIGPSAIREQYVYNLTTVNHSYFINGILVHNK